MDDPRDTRQSTAPETGTHEDGDLSDMLEELRILLPGTQTLTAFLIILPFNNRFAAIRGEEKAVYVVTFLCTLLALVLFTAPAAHHRLQRPLRDREAFKNRATNFMIAGMIPLSVALVLACQLVMSMVVDERWISWSIASALGLILLLLWWIVPIRTRDTS